MGSHEIIKAGVRFMVLVLGGYADHGVYGMSRRF